MNRPARPRRALAIGLAIASVGVPSGAQAAVSVTTPERCFVHWPGQGSQAIPVAVGGLAPGQTVKVELRVAGVTVSGLPQLTADAAGSVTTQLDSWTSGLPDGPARGREAQIVALDLAAGTELGTAEIRVANVDLSVDTAPRRFGTDRHWTISGLSRLGASRTYFAFYLRRGKVVGKQRLGRTEDACGYLRTRRPLIPFRRVGTFELRVQASPRYRASLPWYGGGRLTQRYRKRHKG